MSDLDNWKVLRNRKVEDYLRYAASTAEKTKGRRKQTRMQELAHSDRTHTESGTYRGI